MKIKSIEIWRLFFTISIVLCHACVLPWNSENGKAILHVSTFAVEFFFLLSGFLMAKSVESINRKNNDLTHIGDEAFTFVINKMKPIYPVYVFAAIFELLTHIFLRTSPLKDLIYRVWDMLFLRASGLGANVTTAVGGAWYLSAMFIAMWMIYPLLRKYTNVFMNVIAPLTAILLFGWFESTHTHINFALHIENGICLGLLRAIAVMCFGIFAYSLCEKFKQKAKDNKPSVLVTLVEIIFFVAVFVCLVVFKRSKLDYIIILALTVGIIAAFSGKSYTNVLLNKLNNKWTDWISEFCICLYLNHYAWINTFKNWNLAIPYRYQVIIYLIFSLLTALACFFTIRYIKDLIKKIKEKRSIVNHNEKQ